MTDPVEMLEDAVPHEDEEQVTQKLISEIVDAIHDEDAAQARGLFEDLHPADAADAVEQLSYDQQVALAELVPDVFGGEMLAELQEDTRSDIINELDAGHLAEAIQDLDSDDMTLVVEDLSPEMREQVLAGVPEADRTRLESSLSFEEDTAGRLMQREFVAAPTFWSVGNTIDHMRKAGEDLPDLFFEIFVVDEAFKPVGSVPVSKIMRFARDVKLADIMTPPQAIIRPDRDQEEVAYIFEKYHLISAPVVDDDGRLTGMLTVDDMVDVIQEENKEDMLALAGVSEASSADTVWSSVQARAPWLLVNLFTAILASGVIALFEGAIAQLVALAVLMPIVASMGGNAGTQSLAVAVRAIASRDLTVSNAARVIWREFAAGAVNGLIFAVVMGAVAGIWFQNFTLAWVIGLAMIINLGCAGLAGIMVPLTLKRFGADPAVASSVFVTTVTDVVGFFVFLGLGAMVLL